MNTLAAWLRRLLVLLVALCLSALVLTAGFVLGRMSPTTWIGPIASPAYELVRAEPPAGLLLAGRDDCAIPTEREYALTLAAIDVLSFSAQEGGSLAIGAHKFLANSRYRDVGQPVCDSLESFQRAVQLINGSDHLRRGRPVEYTLNLIARLPGPHSELVAIVAASAFNDTPQESEYFARRDLRPLARATLASLGLVATPFAGRAFAEISAHDSMGTGAAQVAVAGQHPRALDSVERLMADLLATLPKDDVIAWDTRNRLYELAYALAYGGAAAASHAAPIKELMTRRVESNATIFGMIDLQPKRMCRVLADILSVNETELGHDYCADPDVPYEK
ncbi:hypothetical protein [Devosia sp. SL43]|uniref:hypothetical protein n=1 Tax=Devosia sp. SL43 TaxID=2806348 RepID=UPI001F31111F|nr:hypothetical protein [Devosia sp. SL43]UJW84271.1 hypothetical protein IM737_12590 [Devosia sp. SL43]